MIEDNFALAAREWKYSTCTARVNGQANLSQHCIMLEERHARTKGHFLVLRPAFSASSSMFLEMYRLAEVAKLEHKSSCVCVCAAGTCV